MNPPVLFDKTTVDKVEVYVHDSYTLIFHLAIRLTSSFLSIQIAFLPSSVSQQGLPSCQRSLLSYLGSCSPVRRHSWHTCPPPSNCFTHTVLPICLKGHVPPAPNSLTTTRQVRAGGVRGSIPLPGRGTEVCLSTEDRRLRLRPGGWGAMAVIYVFVLLSCCYQ